ncbi:DUF305 domain-containing protein [Nocardioides donggukensis]|uniref:DUF305 domain-containing protein n=1 Tax=Nocardioides donggukensis TaxID=2774019 RepID=A0A927K4L5_9ACTN|nr:DUF305 domain-containing protein [Nocardioides donggukensis]MBD8870399.1 DUF305 domain-containing protein [Nocardioides donggukensis]
MPKNRPRARRLAALALTIPLVLGAAGCGADEADVQPEAVEETAPNGDVFNAADVSFATDMIQHHAQALTMVDLTLGRDLDPEVAALMEQIRDAQAPEIEQMTGWLTDWQQPIPETMRDHANSEGGEMEMGDMPGMMSGEAMADLEASSDADFQGLLLEMMVEHHTGAIQMAESEQTSGTFDPAVELAGQIVTGQQAEIDQMEEMLR